MDGYGGPDARAGPRNNDHLPAKRGHSLSAPDISGNKCLTGKDKKMDGPAVLPGPEIVFRPVLHQKVRPINKNINAASDKVSIQTEIKFCLCFSVCQYC
jgi:hypothetical protein